MSDTPLSSPALIGKTVASVGYKARDVRADIKELGFEKGAERGLTVMADEIVGLRQTVGSLTGLVDKLIDQLVSMSRVNEAVVKQMDELRLRDEKYQGEA